MHVVYYICSGQPPDNLLRDAKNTTKFFKQVGRIYSNSVSSAYRVLTEEEYEAVSPHTQLPPPPSLSLKQMHAIAQKNLLCFPFFVYTFFCASIYAARIHEAANWKTILQVYNTWRHNISLPIQEQHAGRWNLERWV